MTITRIIISLSILTLCSCRPEPLEIILPEQDPQVVVFSQLFPGPLVTVVLSQTLDALAFNEEEGDTLNEAGWQTLLINHASVSISYGDQVEALVPIDFGVYGSINIPQIENETYTLKVSTPQGQDLTASSKLLPNVSFASIEPEVISQGEDTLVQVHYEIADLPESNWYLLNFYTNNRENKIFNNALDTLLEGEGSYLKHTELIANRGESNYNNTGTIRLPTVQASDSLFVSLANISEDYYRYLEIRKTATSLFTELTKEPINSPSNVDGGLGFFNLYFPTVYYFDLNEF